MDAPDAAPGPPSGGALGQAIRTLAEIGYRLRQHGGSDLYRARAFAEAAQTLIARRPDLDTPDGRRGLRQLSGIGERIERVVLEVAEEGGSAYLDRLRAEDGVEPAAASSLDLAGYRGDLHTHTTWSDGKTPLPEMVAAARDRGFAYYGITDHSPRMTIVHGLTPERLRQQRAEMAAVQAEAPAPVLLQGIEVDILEDGSLDLPDDALGELDLVVASPHLKLRMEPPAMTERMLRAVENPAVSILGHPTGRRPGQRAGADYDTEAVLRRAAELGVVVELDCDPNRVDLGPELARRAFELGCDFALDSDAHAPRDLGYPELGLWVPELAGIPADRIVNWLPLDDLRRRLHHR